MDLNSFETLFRSQHRARLFFVKSCWKNYRRFCIRCHGYKVYRIAGKRFRCKRCGQLFQGRFKSFLIEDDRYFTAMCYYIHGSPVRAGIVEEVTAYPCKAHAGGLYSTHIRPFQ